jgi:hypothetical protein
MSTRAGEPSVGMIPRITGGLDSTGCSDHRTSLAENSGATCCPRTIGPAQREHTIGGKLLGGFVCLRRTSAGPTAVYAWLAQAVPWGTPTVNGAALKVSSAHRLATVTGPVDEPLVAKHSLKQFRTIADG